MGTRIVVQFLSLASAAHLAGGAQVQPATRQASAAQSLIAPQP